MNGQTLHDSYKVMLILNDHIKSADFTEIAVVQCGKCVLAEVVFSQTCNKCNIDLVLRAIPD